MYSIYVEADSVYDCGAVICFLSNVAQTFPQTLAQRRYQIQNANNT